MEQRQTRIECETARHRLRGSLRLPPEGYRSRLSDYLNDSERVFLPLTDVTILPLDAEGPLQRKPFVAVSVAHIVMVTQVEE